ncbi:MAG: 50S ribosomal protein L38e [Candidatus Hecatellales archaeon]|nr:MAG: 50S ribosomal protein L38e [Candidatus Hecatellales archaeon]
MPKEVFSEEEFFRLAERAEACRVKRLKNGLVKLKLRTRRYLYTFKVESGRAEEILRKLKCPVEEV